MRKFLLLSLLFVAAVAGAASITSVPVVPSPLRSTDKVPVARDGSPNAYSATVGQIKSYVQSQISSASVAVTSVQGKAGAVVLTAAEVGADPAGSVSVHTSTYNHANIPTTAEKGAMVGTSGAPGVGNAFVTNADMRLSDARAPLAHTQAATTVTEDTAHRFATDTEKAAWNAKQAALTAGVDYLTPTGSASGLTGFPTLNQNTTGTAAALAANGFNCGEGEAAKGVDAAGNAEGCFTPAGGTGGTTDHAALTHLDYASSGHTGFAASSDARFPTTNEKAGMTYAQAPSADNPFATKADLQFTNYSGASVTAATGTIASGTAASTHNAYDNAVLQVNEASGAPGWDVRFTFNAVPHFNQVSARFWYDGSATHDVYIQAYNYGTLTWDSLNVNALHGTSDYAWVTLGVPVDSAYRNGSNTVLIRFYHSTAGSTVHHVFIDYLALSHTSLGGANTEHNQLVGRTVPDAHPTSAITGLDAALAAKEPADATIIKESELSSATNSTSTTTAANSAAVKATYDLAASKAQRSDFNVMEYGAKGDTVTAFDGTVTTASTTFSSPSAAFTSADTGKTILIYGAGAGGKMYQGTVSYVNSTTLALSAAAGTTVTASEYKLGTDDSAAVQSIIDTYATQRYVFPANTNLGATHKEVVVVFPSGKHFLIGTGVTASYKDDITFTGKGLISFSEIKAFAFTGCKRIVFEGTSADGMVHDYSPTTSTYVYMTRSGTNAQSNQLVFRHNKVYRVKKAVETSLQDPKTGYQAIIESNLLETYKVADSIGLDLGTTDDNVFDNGINGFDTQVSARTGNINFRGNHLWADAGRSTLPVNVRYGLDVGRASFTSTRLTILNNWFGDCTVASLRLHGGVLDNGTHDQPILITNNNFFRFGNNDQNYLISLESDTPITLNNIVIRDNSGQLDNATLPAMQFLNVSQGTGNAVIEDNFWHGTTDQQAWPRPKVKVTAADTTNGYLYDKLAAGSNISITRNNAGANETLTLAVSGSVPTASALAANGTNCTTGQAAAGVDASGNAEGCFTPSGGGGNPAGASGQLQYNNAGSFGAATLLTWDAANSRLGLNNTAPSYLLDIKKGAGEGGLDVALRSTDNTVATALDFFEGTTFKGSMAAFGSNHTTASWRDSLHITAATNDTGKLIFRTKTGGVYYERLFVDNGGNVGIGTTSPSQKLDVVGAAKATSFLETVKANGTCSTSINIDPTLGGIQTLTLSGACAIGVTNLAAGQSFTLKLTQSSTTAPTFTSVYKWPAGTAPAWSASATKYDVLSCYSDDGTTLSCNGMVDVR
jgi:hypothetical protein